MRRPTRVAGDSRFALRFAPRLRERLNPAVSPPLRAAGEVVRQNQVEMQAKAWVSVRKAQCALEVGGGLC